MAYITREDGEQFVIPSYRDVLTSRQTSVLKKEILLLSKNYGEYITLQKKGMNQYEVAFSTEPGYLLGESIWHFFKRPADMVFCEAIPNTLEAIVVIVKSGSVYLDGRFPIDTIPEELVVFLTQKNDFEIYIYGDIPLSKESEDGKFSFDASSVKSFTVLDEPVFSKVPLLKIYLLQLVEQVLATQGIGVFPAKKVLTILAVLALIWMGYSWLSKDEEVTEKVTTFVSNPYQGYFSALASPNPTLEIKHVSQLITILLSAPNWTARKITYANGLLTASMLSLGGSLEALSDWAKNNRASVDIATKGISVSFTASLPQRAQVQTIYPFNQVLTVIIDKLEKINPGNNLTLSNLNKGGPFSSGLLSIKLNSVTPDVMLIIGEQLTNLPVVVRGMQFEFNGNGYTGSITIEILGS
jgi:hypothetical protein